MRLPVDAVEPDQMQLPRARENPGDGHTIPEVIEFSISTDATNVNQRLHHALEELTAAPPSLVEAMRYSIEAGGKRLRPILVLWACDAAGGDRQVAWPAALAVEFIHTFSLIHDDLPAIDNDDLRRGCPTSHVRFGEAMAILAGDALMAHAFSLLSAPTVAPHTAVAWVAELAAATGPAGLIGGEVSDIEGERHPPNAELVQAIHDAKTARLIQAACRLGAIAAGAPPTVFDALSRYGRHLGLAFQATDDLLDVQGSGSELGKRAGKDAASGKQTYPRAVGLEAATRLVDEAVQRAINELTPLGPPAEKLAELATYLSRRRS